MFTMRDSWSSGDHSETRRLQNKVSETPLMGLLHFGKFLVLKDVEGKLAKTWTFRLKTGNEVTNSMLTLGVFQLLDVKG